MVESPVTQSVGSRMSLKRPDESTLLIQLSGKWRLVDELPQAEDLIKKLESSTWTKRLTFNSQNITDWDSSLLTFLTKILDHSAQQGLQVENKGLPQGVRKLIERIHSESASVV